MSRAERIGRMRMALESVAGLKTQEVMDRFEVSRSTVARDIQYLRDRLNYSISFDPKRNTYYISDDPTGVPGLELPGLMLSEEEAYALLTLINLSKDLYPGIVQRYTSVVRSVLKFSLHGRGFLMKRLDEKFGVDMPGIQDYDHGVAQRLGRALTDDLLIEASWKEENTIKKAQCYVRRAALRPDGWYITVEDARGCNKGCLYDQPLAAFVHCVIKGRPNKESN
jgi:DNA-binding transcriptional regulator LsrR (DeoR family)